MIKTNWQPRQSDIAWTFNLINRIHDGGIWEIPVNHSVWKIDKTQQVMRCIRGEQDDLYHKLVKVCAALSYRVEYAPGSLPKQVIDAALAGGGKINTRTDLDRFSTTI